MGGGGVVLITTNRKIWILAGLLCLALVTVAYVFLEDEQWKDYNDAGFKAYRQGRYAEAEVQWEAALEEAERFGSDDPRL